MVPTPSQRFLALLRHNIWWRAGLIFLVVCATFTWWLKAQTFTDPDSFYHVAMAEYLWEHKSIPHQFPWLSQTTLSQHYTDHHFLYHILLIPFVTLLDPFLGAKLFTILLAGFLFASVYVLLHRARVPWPLMWSVILYTSGGFMFRLGLVKAPGISLMFLLVGFWLLIHSRERRRSFLLFPLAFLFVWSYGGFIVLLLLTACMILGHMAYGVVQRFGWADWRRVLLEQSFAGACVAVGTFFGLLIHPSFPDHLYLLWQQVIEIGIVNQKDVISVGREWYPPKVGFLVRDQWLLTLAATGAAIAGIRYIRKLQPETWGLAGFAFVLLVFTLRSQRYIEYLVPWLLLASVFIVRDSGIIPAMQRAVVSLVKHHRARFFTKGAAPLYICMLGIFTILLCASTLYSVERTFENTQRDLRGGASYASAKASSEWLAAHTDPGSIVYTSDWDVFPELFYYNRSNYYIVGLDPTFMYNHSANAYWTWFNINTGRQTTGVVNDIIDVFGSTTIFVEADNKRLQKTLVADSRIREEYRDDFAVIYSVQSGIAAPAEGAESPEGAATAQE